MDADTILAADDLLALYAELGESFHWGQSIKAYQLEGSAFCALAERAICADGMGLGKTLESIAWLDLIDAKRTVIVAEAGVCDQFAAEVSKWAPHRQVFNFYKQSPERRTAMLDEVLNAKLPVIVVNYELVRLDKELEWWLIEMQPDSLIVDEAHNIKSTGTANYKMLSHLVEMENVCPECGEPMHGLFIHGEPDPETGKRPRPKLASCRQCGWTKRQHVPDGFDNPLDLWLSMRSIKYTLLLTGTPILNSPEDLYPLLHFCQPVVFPTKNGFLSRFCANNVFSGKWEFLPNAIDWLKPLMEDFYIERHMEDVADELGEELPPDQVVEIVPIDFDRTAYPLQWRTMKQLNEAAAILLSDGSKMNIMNIIALITRKRQCNVWPGGIEMRDSKGNLLFSAKGEVNESIKMDVLSDGVELLLEEGRRQIVFSQFSTALRELEARFTARGWRVAVLDGETAQGKRKKIKADFADVQNPKPEWDLLLANYKTGGTGLNLRGATEIHVLDEEWNPGKQDQSFHRNYRLGQTQETHVYVYRLKGTIDTWMAGLKHRKQMMVDEFRQKLSPTSQDNDLVAQFRDALKRGEI